MTQNHSSEDLNNPETWKINGNDYFKKGDYESAIKCYTHALEQDPKYIEAWNNLGLSLLKIGKVDEAKQVNEKIKALKSEQQSIPSQNNSYKSEVIQQKKDESSLLYNRDDLYYAGVWDREFAYIIDFIIAGIIAFSIFFLGRENYIISIPAAFLAFWLYFALLEGCDMQATIGKKALKIFVTTDGLTLVTYKRSIARSLLKIVLTITPFSLITLINGIAAHYSAKSKGLHDHIAGTLVVTKKISEKKIDGSVIPSKSLSKWYILILIIVVGFFLIVISAVIAAFVFGMAGATSPSSLGPTSVNPSVQTQTISPPEVGAALTEQQRSDIVNKTIPVANSITGSDSPIVLRGKVILFTWTPGTNYSHDYNFWVPDDLVATNNDKGITVLLITDEEYEQVGIWIDENGKEFPGFIKTSKIIGIYWPDNKPAGVAHVVGSAPKDEETFLYFEGGQPIYDIVWDKKKGIFVPQAIVGDEGIEQWISQLPRS